MICRQAEIKAFSFKIPLYILLGAAIVVGISVIPAGTSGSQSENWFFSAMLLILAGLIAAVALILPGISVSYLLLLLGLYDKTMQAISEFYMPFFNSFSDRPDCWNHRRHQAAGKSHGSASSAYLPYDSWFYSGFDL